MASLAHAAEATWPTGSASDFAILVTMQRFRIYADHCSDKVPSLKPRFEILMESLSRRIQGVSQSLLSSDEFRGMKKKPVPTAISFAFEDSLEDARRNFERQDADSICPKKLQTLGEMGVASLGHDLTQTFMAVQGMIQNLEKEGAGDASRGSREQRRGSP